MKQSNEYQVYLRKDRKEDPKFYYFQANDMAAAQIEVRKFLQANPEMWQMGKIRRAYKTSNAGTYAPAGCNTVFSNI